MNEMKDSGLDVILIGKIFDIYDGEGIIFLWRIVFNMDGMDKVIDMLGEDFIGLSFVNFVDFDVLFGYCCDLEGYGCVFEEFDVCFLEVFEKMKEDDLLIIIVDYGNDLIYYGIDYICEYVLIFVYSKKYQKV